MNFWRKMLSDKAGHISSRRFAGLLLVSTGTVSATMIVIAEVTGADISAEVVDKISYLVIALVSIGAGLLGVTTAEFFAPMFKNYHKPSDKPDTKPQHDEPIQPVQPYPDVSPHPPHGDC